MDISVFGDFELFASTASTVNVDPDSYVFPVQSVEASIIDGILFYVLLLDFLVVGAFGVLGLIGLFTNNSPIRKIAGIGLLASIGLIVLLAIAIVVVRLL